MGLLRASQLSTSRREMNDAPQTRLASLDAYRGFVMLLMMAEV
jgi:uncharacterized membrane protein